MENLSKEERHRLALKKLARLFKGNNAPSSRDDASRAEAEVLREILRRTNQEDIAKLVEGRLTVISAQNGSSSSSSSSSVDSDREGSDDGDEAEGRRDAVDSSDHGNNMGPRSEPRPAQPIKASAAQVLRDLANGVRPVPEGLVELDLWRKYATGSSENSCESPSSSPPPAAAAAAAAAAALTSTASVTAAELQSLREGLKNSGYFVLESSRDTEAALCSLHAAASLCKALERLQDAGWPPVFVFMLDEAWKVVGRAQELAKVLLGEEGLQDVLLEPSVFAWALPPPGCQPSKKLGTNFGLPHRDYTHNEAIHSDGSVRLLSVWVPLNDATLDNGCISVLPKEADALWSSGSHPGHMRCATSLSPGGDHPVSEIRFPLACSRPIPAKAGSMLGWAGNTVHWGATCMRGSPRRSIAFTLKATKDRGETAEPEQAGGCCDAMFRYMSIEEARSMSLERRFRLCCRAVLLYSQWFDLPRSALPEEFWALLVPEAGGARE